MQYQILFLILSRLDAPKGHELLGVSSKEDIRLLPFLHLQFISLSILDLML